MRPIDADALNFMCRTVLIRYGKGCLKEKVAVLYEDIQNAPTIALKEYAKAEGYSIIKRNPMPKLKPCPRCGASGRKIEEWCCRTGYFYICSECDHQSNPARSERKARENWNEIG